MSFEFGGIKVDTPKKQVVNLSSNIEVFSRNLGRDKHILFLVNSPRIARNLVSTLGSWCDSNAVGFDYHIISASNVDVSQEEIEKGSIYLFFIKNKSDFIKYVIPGKTVIVTFGWALNAITLSSDLTVESFYDYMFNKTYFYSPDTGTYVFPVDDIYTLFKPSLDAWMPMDNSRHSFAKYQIKYIKTHYAELKSGLDEERVVINKLSSTQDFSNLMKEYDKPCKVAWDIETDGFSYFRNRVGCITMSFDGSTGWFVPWRLVNKDLLSNFFRNKYQIGQNLKFDIKFLKHLGVENLHINSDTLYLGHTLNEMRFNGLKSLAYYYSPFGGYDRELDTFIRLNKPSNYLAIPETILSGYATMDAIVSYHVHEVMQKQLDYVDKKYPPIHEGGWSVRKFYETVRVPSANSFIDIEQRGLFVNMEKWDRNSTEIDGRIQGIKEELSKQLFLTSRFGLQDSSFDSFLEEDEEETASKGKELQSSVKLGNILKELGWENLGETKRGSYLTGDEQLSRWLQLGHSEAKLIQNLRSYSVLQKTFMGKKDTKTGWREYVDCYPDGSHRINSSYKVMMNDTYRNACGDPNYQQSPSNSIDAHLFKQIYSVPNKDTHYLVTLDKASFQLRLAALDSEDPVMMKAYKDNPDVDMHLMTAYSVFMAGSDFTIDEVVLREGDKVIKKFGFEEVIVKRNGETIKVAASDAIESDYLIG